MYTLGVKTTELTSMMDITHLIREIVTESGVKSGVCTVFVPHTTAGITINENTDPGVRSDVLKVISGVVPLENDYAHRDGNSAAHIKASLFGSSLQAIIEDGRLILGTWQGIYLCEFDGPRNRKVYVQIIKNQ